MSPQSRSKLGPLPDSAWDQDTSTRTRAELEAEAPGFAASMKDHLDKMRKVRDAAAKKKDKNDGQKTNTQKTG